MNENQELLRAAPRNVSNRILDAIGNTPLVELRNVVPPNSARIVAKLESANPTGSMKDRMARALIERAAAEGHLPPGGTVVEYTAGTTGISLAFVAAALGYSTHFIFSDAFSDEKRRTMEAYGARITDVPSDNKRINADLMSGSHQIEGIGIGFVPPLWTRAEVDEITTVSTADAKAMARRLAREEAIFAGTSTGANVVAAVRVAERLGAGRTVLTIIIDSGLRYLTTDVFRK